MAADQTIEVLVVFSAAARVVREITLRVAPGTTVMQAVSLSGVIADDHDTDGPEWVVGVWGRKVTPRRPLQDRDRIEVYRPLKVDPKVARRERFVKQGARTVGLFAGRRPGAKAGY